MTERFTHIIHSLLKAGQEVIERNIITGRLRLEVPASRDLVKLFVFGRSRFVQFETELKRDNPIGRTVALKNRTVVFLNSFQRIIVVAHEPVERKPGAECPGRVIERRKCDLQH